MSRVARSSVDNAETQLREASLARCGVEHAQPGTRNAGRALLHSSSA
jgi:hypothetical protein